MGREVLEGWEMLRQDLSRGVSMEGLREANSNRI